MADVKRNWAEQMFADDPSMIEAMADFAAFICDDPENGRTSPLTDRPTGTGIPLAKMIAQSARKQR
jgi:hypothetical protein